MRKSAEMADSTKDYPQEKEEEDWSAFIQSSGDNSLTGNSFARHDCMEEFSLNGGGTVLKIASVAALSPIDMVNLSWGTNDATGHRIWLGAKLFLHAIPRLNEYFVGKSILEVGAGTGIAGIAIDKSLQVQQLILTDGSQSALDLCRRNCEANRVSDRVNTQRLCWGEALPVVACDGSVDSEVKCMPFDTMIAADVIYDLTMWCLILKTAKLSLRDDGFFVLSHCPRAAVPLEDARKGLTIEDILVQQAKEAGFDHISTVPPNDLASLPLDEQMDMLETGAAIMVFQKQLDMVV
jgi:predicted nicotinamide N-methyase